MLRVRLTANELKVFSVGFFLMSSVQIHQLLTGYGRYRKIGSKKSVRNFSSAVSLNDIKDASTEERKKSALYTKTGDKGFSSVSSNAFILPLLQ